MDAERTKRLKNAEKDHGAVDFDFPGHIADFLSNESYDSFSTVFS